MTKDEYLDNLISSGVLPSSYRQTMANILSELSLPEDTSPEPVFKAYDKPVASPRDLPLTIAHNYLQNIFLFQDPELPYTYNFSLKIEKETMVYHIDGKVILVRFRDGVEYHDNGWSGGIQQVWRLEFEIKARNESIKYDSLTGTPVLYAGTYDKEEKITVQNYNTLWEALESVAFKDPEHWFNIYSDYLSI